MNGEKTTRALYATADIEDFPFNVKSERLRINNSHAVESSAKEICLPIHS
jgi:hypothetical protein